MSSANVDYTQNVGARVAKARKYRGYTQKDFASRPDIHFSYRTLQNIESGDKQVTSDEMKMLSAALNVSPYWLKTGDGSMDDYRPVSLRLKHSLEGRGPASSAAMSIQDDYVEVPRYDIQASAGDGALIESEQVVDHLAFKRNWTRSRLGLDPTKLALIEADGDSMNPTIQSGDLLLIDLREAEPRDTHIYVLNVDNELRVKRLRIPIGEKKVIIISDNALIEDETISVARFKNAATIIGRVVWIGRTL